MSLSSQQKVLTEFLTLFPATLELSFFAMLLAIAVGVPAGAFAAVKRGGFYDQALMTVSLFGYSMPIFWWGLLLIMFVSVRLGLLPVSGRIDPINFDIEGPTGFMLIDSSCPIRRAPSSTPCAISSCRRSCSAQCRSRSSLA